MSIIWPDVTATATAMILEMMSSGSSNRSMMSSV
jgi:hypothetical protein